MNYRQLILHSLRHYWKSTLAVILGVMIGTASLTGALVVGDSMRGSLKQMTLERLSFIDEGLIAPRFFREELAQEVTTKLKAQQITDVEVAPALFLMGSLVRQKSDTNQNIQRVNQVNLIGADQRFWSLIDRDAPPCPVNNQIVLSHQAADELHVKVGDTISILLEIPSAIPRDILLGEREETTQEIIVTVSAIGSPASGPSHFSIMPSQRSPLVAYVSLDMLQGEIGLQHVEPSRRNPETKPAKVNALFAGRPALKTDLKGQSHPLPHPVQESTQQVLKSTIQLADLDLRLVTQQEKGYLSLESTRLILETPLIQAAEKTLTTMPEVNVSQVYVYLVNEFTNTKNPKDYSVYSIMAGMDIAGKAPFGPLVNEKGEPVAALGDGEIALTDWLAEDLKAQVGDTIHCKYNLIGNKGELPDEEINLVVKSIIKLQGTPADDRGLVPEVEGFTTVDSMQDLDQPFPMDLSRVTPRDDSYWDEHRATPKAYVSLKTAQKLWQSRYGNLTSIRIAPPAGGDDLAKLSTRFQSALLKQIDVTDFGFRFQHLRQDGLAASQGSNDFGGLFIGFSLFLIVAALLLVGLIYRLGIEQRGEQIGLFQALGASPAQVRCWFLGEGIITTVIGVILGAGLAAFYGWAMIWGLTHWWMGAVGTQSLQLHLSPVTLIAGSVSMLILSLLTIYFSLRGLATQNPVQLLFSLWKIEGYKQQPLSMFMRIVGAVCGIGSLILLVLGLIGVIPHTEATGGLPWTVFSFFLSGMGLLACGLIFAVDLMALQKSNAVSGVGFSSLFRLAARNTSRNASRTVASITLVGLATFLVVAVALGQYNPTYLKPELDSGNGGFRLVAQSTRPIQFDWQTPAGRSNLDWNISNDMIELVSRTKTFRMLQKQGEEASCLNLYQTQLPTILSVSQTFIVRGGFAFAQTPGTNPWKILETKTKDNNIPIFGDMNTLQFSLHKGPGDKLDLGSDTKQQGEIAGMLSGSVFQGVLLMSEDHFRQLYPTIVGAQYFLIEASAEDADKVASLLETNLSDYGMDVETVAERQRKFLEVQNTYLSTFQTLGGFGLLLGTMGVAIVMLRNVLERQKEFALMRALGFMPGYIYALVFIENGLVVTYGVITGCLAALISMAPHLHEMGDAINWPSLLITIGSVLAAGILSGLIAARASSQFDVIETLRN
jgi:ABC-type lipoprotein release transport system permease subunit